MSDLSANKAALKNLYRCWHETRGACVDKVIDLCDDNISFGSLAEGADPAAFTARVTGKQNLHNYFDGLIDQWSMEHYTVHDMIAEGDCVVVIATTAWINKLTGKKVDTPKVDVWRFAAATPD